MQIQKSFYGRDGTFGCGSAAIFRAMLDHEREHLQSVKTLPPVGGARSATQQKGARWGIASSLSATRVYPWKRLSGASKLQACRRFSMFEPIHCRESQASPKPPSPPPCMEFGIIYAHVPAMGCLKSIRDRYKRDGDWAAYTRRFLAHLEGETDAVAGLARIAGRSPSCDFNRCHRTYVARAVAKLAGLQVIHLTDRTEIPDVTARSAA